MYLGNLGQDNVTDIPGANKKRQFIDIPEAKNSQFIAIAEKAAEQAREAVKDPLGRKFFEASVYRNLADIVSELKEKGEAVIKDTESCLLDSRSGTRVISVGGRSEIPVWYAGPIFSRQVIEFILGKYKDITGEDNWPAYFYIKKYFKYTNPSIIEWAKRYVSGHDWAKRKVVRIGKNIKNWSPSKSPPSICGNIDIDFYINDIVRESINLERELNRVHLPMPGDLRSWAFRARSLSTVGAKNRIILHDHFLKFDKWMQKIEKSLKEAELRAEELKRKQQQQAEIAYKQALEKARNEYIKQLEKEKEQAKKKAAEKAKEKAKEESKPDESKEEEQARVKKAVQEALQKQEEEFTKRISKITGDLKTYERLAEKARKEREAAEKAKEKAEKAKQEAKKKAKEKQEPVYTIMPVQPQPQPQPQPRPQQSNVLPIAIGAGILALMLGGG